MHPNEILKIKHEQNLDFIFCSDFLNVIVESKGSGGSIAMETMREKEKK